MVMTCTELPATIDQELKLRSKQWERTNRYLLVRRGNAADDEVIGANLTAEAAKALAVKLTKYSAGAQFVVKPQASPWVPDK